MVIVAVVTTVLVVIYLDAHLFQEVENPDKEIRSQTENVSESELDVNVNIVYDILELDQIML